MRRPKEFYTIREAARLIGYSERQLRAKCIGGEIPGAYKLPTGRKWVIPRKALEKYHSAATDEETPGDELGQEPMADVAIERNGRRVAPARDISLGELCQLGFPPDVGTVLLLIHDAGDELGRSFVETCVKRQRESPGSPWQRGLLLGLAELDPASAPVLQDAVRYEIWRGEPQRLAFRAHVQEIDRQRHVAELAATLRELRERDDFLAGFRRELDKIIAKLGVNSQTPPS